MALSSCRYFVGRTLQLKQGDRGLGGWTALLLFVSLQTAFLQKCYCCCPCELDLKISKQYMQTFFLEMLQSCLFQLPKPERQRVAGALFAPIFNCLHLLLRTVFCPCHECNDLIHMPPILPFFVGELWCSQLNEFKIVCCGHYLGAHSSHTAVGGRKNKIGEMDQVGPPADLSVCYRDLRRGRICPSFWYRHPGPNS